ncbi:CCGSCS motif protein [Aliivibrio sifiae]|jgi:CCGSCS motif protein|uniref:CCGSCS motif protein n=1 Tax=Aliivibrio sifiae TaxID=566293 RepID=A0A2S7XCY2_9GAMM|nr:CCGSCS motif protein [Aliivibrio sifiae]PQJ89219.1 CCGSCS motif protein [Aliivibrio sifiae]
MTLSFTKIFKKSENKPTDDKLVQQPILNEKKSFEDKEKKVKKHGEPGVCCGSCS